MEALEVVALSLDPQGFWPTRSYEILCVRDQSDRLVTLSGAHHPWPFQHGSGLDICYPTSICRGWSTSLPQGAILGIPAVSVYVYVEEHNADDEGPVQGLFRGAVL